jgi:hypothetical protein
MVSDSSVAALRKACLELMSPDDSTAVQQPHRANIP